MRQAFLSDKGNDKLDEDGAMEVVKGIIIENAIEKTILGGRDINSIDSKSERAAAKAFYDIASGLRQCHRRLWQLPFRFCCRCC